MRQPAFWFARPDRPGLWPRLLSPLGWMTARATARRVAKLPRHWPDIPVICVGNLNLGGTGKTPAVIALSGMLSASGWQPHVLSRGYKGNVEGPARVDPRHHRAEDVGDEPLLISAFCPVWVGRDRVATARAAEASGADILIMDDGFQYPDLAKDLSLVIVDATRGFGNRRCAPAGPLREPVIAGLARADGVIAIGTPAECDAFRATIGGGYDRPVLGAQLEPLETGMDWRGQRFLAFAGIGHPEKFFATLRGLGADLVETVALSDHQAVPSSLANRLSQRARQLNAQLVTTEKDAVRLPKAFQREILSLPVRLRFAAPDDVQALLGTL